jgi:hypothetical protein
MRYRLNSSSSLGVGVPWPITWEDFVANNMTTIPFFEFNAGGLVEDLYKAYVAGLQSGAFDPYAGEDPLDQTVGYIADNTGYPGNEVKDFLDSMVKTISQGNAPATILQGTAPVTTEVQAAAGSVVSAVTSAASAVSNTAASALKPLETPLLIGGVVLVALFALYAASQGAFQKVVRE